MGIYQLRSFVTVVKLGNLTRAAEELHVTQPAVTAQIKALEEELGLTLFESQDWANCTHANRRSSPSRGAAADIQSARTQRTCYTCIFDMGDLDSLRLASLLSSMVQTLPLLEIKTRQGHAEDLRELVATETLNGSFYIGLNIPRDVLGIPLQTIHYRTVGPFGFGQKLLHAGWGEISEMPWIGASHRHHAHVLLRDLFARQGLAPNIAVEPTSPRCNAN